MEIQLLQFVRKVETLADVRNLDPRNPIAIDYDMPGMSMRFRVVGSITEPTYQAYPINTIWVVLDANSPYYHRTLQLKSLTPNDTAFADRVTDVQYLGTWVEVTAYDDLFLFPQYYASGSGGGEIGPPGKDGYVVRGSWSETATYAKDHAVYRNGSSYSSIADGNVGHEPGAEGWETYWVMVAREGETPEIDYEYIITEALNRYEPEPEKPTRLEIRGLPATMYSNEVAAFQVWAFYANGSSVRLNKGLYNIVFDRSLGNIDFANETLSVVANSLNGSMPLEAVLVADESITGSYNQATKRLLVTSLTLAGSTSVAEKTTAQYSAKMNFNNGTQQDWSPGPQSTWSVSPTTAGSINASGLFTAADVSANVSAVIKLVFDPGQMQDGVALPTAQGTRNITVTNVEVPQKAIFGVGERIRDMALYNSAFVNRVCTSEVSAAGIVNSFEVTTASSAEFGFYAHPKKWGIARFEDLDALGFYGAWDGAQDNILDPSKRGPVTVSVTRNGVTEDYYLYRQDRANLGRTRWSVTLQP